MQGNPLERLSLPALVSHPSPKVKRVIWSPTTSMCKHETAFSPDSSSLVHHHQPDFQAAPWGCSSTIRKHLLLFGLSSTAHFRRACEPVVLRALDLKRKCEQISKDAVSLLEGQSSLWMGSWSRRERLKHVRFLTSSSHGWLELFRSNNSVWSYF